MKGTRSQKAWHSQDEFPDLPSPTTRPPQTPTTGSTTLRETPTVDPTGSRDPPLAWGSHKTPPLAQQDPEEVSSIASSNTPTKGDQLEAIQKTIASLQRQLDQLSQQQDGKQTSPNVKSRHNNTSKPSDTAPKRKPGDTATHKAIKGKHKERQEQENSNIQLLAAIRSQQAKISDLPEFLQAVSTANTGDDAYRTICDVCQHIRTIDIISDPSEDTAEANIKSIRRLKNRQIRSHLMRANCAKGNSTLEAQLPHEVVRYIWNKKVNELWNAAKVTATASIAAILTISTETTERELAARTRDSFLPPSVTKTACKNAAAHLKKGLAALKKAPFDQHGKEILDYANRLIKADGGYLRIFAWKGKWLQGQDIIQTTAYMPKKIKSRTHIHTAHDIASIQATTADQDQESPTPDRQGSTDTSSSSEEDSDTPPHPAKDNKSAAEDSKPPAPKAENDRIAHVRQQNNKKPSQADRCTFCDSNEIKSKIQELGLVGHGPHGALSSTCASEVILDGKFDDWSDLMYALGWVRKIAERKHLTGPVTPDTIDYAAKAPSRWRKIITTLCEPIQQESDAIGSTSGEQESTTQASA